MWNNFNNPYYMNNQNVPYQNAVQPPYVNLPTPKVSNKLYVTSADDALSRFSAPNTITVYWLQDESCVFEIYTDFQGKKNIVTRKFEVIKEEAKPVEQPQVDFITRKEFEELKTKIDLLSNKTVKKKGVEVDEQ